MPSGQPAPRKQPIRCFPSSITWRRFFACWAASWIALALKGGFTDTATGTTGGTAAGDTATLFVGFVVTGINLQYQLPPHTFYSSGKYTFNAVKSIVRPIGSNSASCEARTLIKPYIEFSSPVRQLSQSLENGIPPAQNQLRPCGYGPICKQSPLYEDRELRIIRDPCG